MYKYKIPTTEINQLFSETEINEAKKITYDELLFPFFKKLSFDELYAQGYSAEYMTDILLGDISYFENSVNDTPWTHPTLSKIFNKQGTYTPKTQIQKNTYFTNQNIVAQEKLKNIHRLNNRDEIINSVNIFCLKENDISFEVFDNKLSHYNKFHVVYAINHGLNIYSTEKLDNFSAYEYPLLKTNSFLDSLSNLNYLPESSNAYSLSSVELDNFEQSQEYVSSNFSILHPKYNQTGLNFIEHYFNSYKLSLENGDSEHSISKNFLNKLVTIAYLGLRKSKAPLTYHYFYDHQSFNSTYELTNPNKQEVIKSLNKINPLSKKDLAQHLLLDRNSFCPPETYELIGALNNLASVLSSTEYNIENIKKYLPLHLSNVLNQFLEGVEFHSQDLQLEEYVSPNPSELLVYVYPLLSKFHQIKYLNNFDIAFYEIHYYHHNKIYQKPKTWKNEHFTNHYNLEVTNNNNYSIFPSFIPFKSLSFQDIITNCPKLLQSFFKFKINNFYDTEYLDFVKKGITYIHDHINSPEQQNLDLSYKDLYTYLTIIQFCLKDKELYSTVQYLLNKKIDISLFTVEKTPILYSKIQYSNSNTHLALTTIINDELKDNPYIFRNDNPNFFIDYLKSKPLFYLEPTMFISQFGLPKIKDIFSPDYKEIPFILDEMPLYKGYVINKEIIAELLEINSPHLQHPDIQKFLRSYYGISILTDHEYSRPPLNEIFLTVSEDEKQQFAQFFINDEMFILDGFFHDKNWKNYISADCLSDIDYITKVLEQTLNFYSNDEAYNSCVEFLNILSIDTISNSDNFQKIFNKLSNNTKTIMDLTRQVNLLSTEASYLFNNQANIIYVLDKSQSYTNINDDINQTKLKHYDFAVSFLSSLNPNLRDILPDLKNSPIFTPEETVEYIDTFFLHVDRMFMEHINKTSTNPLKSNKTFKKF